MNAPASTASILPATLTIPPLAPGELYAGLVLEDGAWHHLILLPAVPSRRMTWSKALEWAKEQGGDLPTRNEQAVLYGNLRGEFEADWYWSNQQHASDAGFAWMQYFGTGHQIYLRQSSVYRARAVRRSII